MNIYLSLPRLLNRVRNTFCGAEETHFEETADSETFVTHVEYIAKGYVQYEHCEYLIRYAHHEYLTKTYTACSFSYRHVRLLTVS